MEINEENIAQNSTSTGNQITDLTREKNTEPNALQIPSISLPKGGGALKGIDEKFEVNAANGTAGFSIPLPLSPGRNGFSPSLALSYNSGGGNSPYGLGWSVDHPIIQRKTDKQLPRYRNGKEEDVFMFSGAEDLVSYLNSDTWQPSEIEEEGFLIHQYKPRLEGGFARIERITQTDTANIYWKVTTPDNTTTFFGITDGSRLSDPENTTKIYAWLPEFSYDNNGNWIRYNYKTEDMANVPDVVSERNRNQGIALFTNRYLKRITYGNRQAWYSDDPYNPTLPAPDAEYFFELVMDYGEHKEPDNEEQTPAFEEIRFWDARPDPFSSFRPGFEIRTYRLCQRILMFHHFEEEVQFAGTPEETGFGSQYLVRSQELNYEPSDINDSRQAELTYLNSLIQSGFIRREDGTYSKKSLPPMEFEYQRLQWNTEVKAVQPESVVHAPAGLTNNYQWVDLYGEGISGILTEQAKGWYYKSNLGGTDETGQVTFTEARAVLPKPSFNGLQGGALSLQDLSANGEKQLVVDSPGVHGYFEIKEDDWEPFRAFSEIANVDMRDSNTRLLDLTGDGQPDIVLTEDNVFTWFAANGKKGYKPAESSYKPIDEEIGPALVFTSSASQESVFLADMTGDGLTDIVRIRNGEICYWANKGYGKFSAKITMGNSPLFDYPQQFNLKYLQLADVSGTGATDILYLGKNRFKAYLNLSGNAWSDAHEIDPFFVIDTNAKVSVIDLMGTGTSCIVWSSDLPSASSSPMRYMDLMDSKKPHVMTRYVNNLGKETTLEYKSSTYFYLKDKLAGKPWITKLPFPVHVISKLTVEEKITRVRFSNEYRYHHGYYDHSEREFRGFGMVEQIDTEIYDSWQADNSDTQLEQAEELYQSPTLTRTWYHTGAFLDKERILNQFEHEYWYVLYNETFPDAPITVTEPNLPDAQLVGAQILPNADAILNHLTADEWREALRACKGMVLRQEVFALDGTEEDVESMQRQAKPFSVATHNCHIQLLQPRRENPFAVFMVTESEAITFQYERDENDPRIAHSLNTQIDELGNILEAASVVYPRQQANPELPLEIQEIQAQTLITYSRNQYTNDINESEAYRLRGGFEAETFEITGLMPSDTLYRLTDFEDILGAASTEIGYHESPTGGTQHRLIEQVRTLYSRDDLTGPLNLGELESQGIGFESYQLGYTPDLIADIFGDRIQDINALMTEGRYMQQDGNWWIRSGTTQFLQGVETQADARERFYSPLTYTDPFGSVTSVSYYADYFLLMASTTDAIGNVAVVERYNFRTLAPIRMRDPNNNISEVLMDELGLVKAMAVMGKGNEADDLQGLTEITEETERSAIQEYLTLTDTQELRDTARELLQQATVRFVYDLGRYYTSVTLLEEQLEADFITEPCAVINLLPTVGGSIAREQHHQANSESPLQLSYEYSDGTGNVAMVKVQAEPGEALQLDIEPDCSFTLETVDTDNQLRWIGNGRTILNNKGNPVKQYEPYFSTTPFYEDAKELVERGVTPIIFYDAMGRNIRTELPDGTLTRVTFDAWQQASYDPNDTVMDSQWYQDRGSPDSNGPPPANVDSLAAWKAAQHHDTPAILHVDTLGRPVFSIAHNRAAGVDELQHTQIDLDIEGNTRAVFDARANSVMQYRYDLLGHRVHENSMDAGERWMLNNVAGNPLRAWDSRDHTFFTTYDELQRPLELRVEGGDGQAPLDNVYERVIYGEDQPNDQANNLRGQVSVQYDTAGSIQNEQFDFKGNLLFSTRQLAIEYRNTPDWSGPNPDSVLENEVFSSAITYDALNRPVTSTTPDSSITTPTYNEAGLLESVSVNMAAANGNGRVEEVFVQQISYDEKGRRQRILYGNNILTRYSYDPVTFRLTQLISQRQNNELLQDLNYTYDPVGNITDIEDRAIPTIFFGNHQIEPRSQYTYDALYRLIEAEGREHIAQNNFNSEDNWNDLPFLVQHQVNDPMAWRNYTQTYGYDGVGNIRQMRHQAQGGNWTRTYEYETDSNRLQSTTVAGQTHFYPHHTQHGFMTEMPHLSMMQWNFKDELQAVARQVVNMGTPDTTYYVYDGSGQRVRKITENESLSGAAVIREERIYLGGVEIFRRHSGTNTGLERQTLHVSDDSGRIAMVDTRNEIDDDTDVRTIRYQLSNYLGSATLETNENAEVISYEEYHPYGTTAYQAVNANIRAAAKRYRYTGMERDEETGLNYHSARYYLPWLGRWTASDPIGIGDGVNVYQYAHNHPIRFSDINGTDGVDTTQIQADITALVQRLATTESGSDESRQIIEGVQILREVAGFSPDGPESVESQIGREKLREQQVKHMKSKKRISQIAENRDRLAISAAKGTAVLYATGAIGTLVGMAAVSYGLGAVGIGATSGFASGLVSGAGNELLRQSETGEEIDVAKVAVESTKEGYTGAALGGVLGAAGKLIGRALGSTYSGTSIKGNTIKGKVPTGGAVSRLKPQTSSKGSLTEVTDAEIDTALEAITAEGYYRTPVTATEAGNAVENMVPVSRWGRPGLQLGDWVMKGKPTLSNFLRSFKWDPNPSNIRVPLSEHKTGEGFMVPPQSVEWPPGWGLEGKWRGLYGQRKYNPNYQ